MTQKKWSKDGSFLLFIYHHSWYVERMDSNVDILHYVPLRGEANASSYNSTTMQVVTMVGVLVLFHEGNRAYKEAS